MFVLKTGNYDILKKLIIFSQKLLWRKPICGYHCLAVTVLSVPAIVWGKASDGHFPMASERSEAVGCVCVVMAVWTALW